MNIPLVWAKHLRWLDQNAVIMTLRQAERRTPKHTDRFLHSQCRPRLNRQRLRRMIRDDDSSAMILSLDIQVSNNATLTPDQRESLLRLLKTKACEIETILAMHPASTKIITQARSTGVGLVSVDHRSA